MQSLSEILRRNRTVILLFTVMVIIPSVFLAFLGFRAIRLDNVDQQFQLRSRQREITLALNDELKGWLFSARPDGAASQALLRFTIDGDLIAFPDLVESISAKRRRNPVPGDSPRSNSRDPEAAPTAAEVEEVYYPRIQVFLRDFRLGQNSGTQYFRRLNAMIVQVPGTPNGYVLESPKLMEFSTRKLDEMTASENFRGYLQIAEAGEPASGGQDVISLPDFTFFRVDFSLNDAPRPDMRRNILLYSTVLLTVVTVLGGLFLYRAVSHEMAVAQLQADFVSAVSHEFRTPLSSMLALLERVKSGRVIEKDMLQRYLQTLQQEANRLGALVDNLLDFAQYEAGKRELSFERVDLDGILAETVDRVRQSRFGERVTQSPSQGERPTYVIADGPAIIQCVRNLIENALKYSPASTQVLVRSGRQDGAPFVEVIDHGIGIPVRDQRKIFGKSTEPRMLGRVMFTARESG